MIAGVVNSQLEATVQLLVRGLGGHEQEIAAVVDTGFNGFLTVSPALVMRLGLPRIGRSRVLLASGQEVVLDLYETAVRWDGEWRTVEADAAEADALVGMALLHTYSVYIESVAGGRVVIASLS